jgi:4-amino-4-deoxy-L-arabinose transferase-like glycosyltransferase
MAKLKKAPMARVGKIENPAYSVAKIDRLANIEAWLSARKNWVAGGVFLLSVILHTIFFLQAKDTPLKSMHQWGNSDMSFFDQSARRIAAGDWLCDAALHPYHDWHNEFAGDYFKEYPETAASYYAHHLNPEGSADTLAARREWINEIYQGKVYHQEPMYVYLLAATYRLFGLDPNWIYLWQLLLGACTNVLVFLIGRRYFGSLTGLLAAVVVMVSGPIMVFQMTILRTSLTAFLTLLLLFYYQKMLDNQDRKSQLIFGAVGGVSMLTQSYFLLFFVPALAWYAWENRRDVKKTALGLGYIIGALMLIMLPLFIRNVKVGAPMTAMASHGAINLILFNSSNAAPLEPNYVHFPSAVKLMHDSGGKFMSAAVACLESFEKPGDLMNLFHQKMGGLFMWYEVPNNMSYYMYREFSPLLKALPAPYWLIAPLGICGLFFGFWRFRWRFLPIFLMVLASASPLFISASLARFRAPFVILMTLLAAFFVIDLVKNLLTLKWKEVLGAVIMIALTSYYTGHIREKEFFIFFPSDIMPFYVVHYKDKLLALEKSNKNDEYLALTTELIGYVPEYFRTVRSSHKVHYSNEANCCNSVANLFRMHADILKDTGNDSESDKFSERAKILRDIAGDFNRKMNR